ncbi:MAG TPA: glycosyltransferase family 4 protein [Actinoplanes sp.]
MASVCVVRGHYVPQDSRVAREVGALVALGHHVDVVCLRAPHQPPVERHPGMTVWRLPLRHSRGGRGLRYAGEYAAFFTMAAATVTALHLRRRYLLVQVNSLPDVLVFAAAVPRLLGARVLLDLQECMPEFFATKFGVGGDHRLVRLIGRLEQLSIRFADAVITPTAQMREVFVGRGAAADKVVVVMDGADEETFRPVPVAGDGDGDGDGDGTFTLISHGTVEEHYGLDTVIEAVAQLRDELPGLRLRIYGDGSDVARLRELTARLGVADRVRFSDGFVPIEELVAAIGRADAGIVAMRRDAFRDVSLAGKMFDFIAMGKPVVSSRTRSVEETLGSSCVELFESGDAVDLARALRRLHGDPQRRRALVRRAGEVAAAYQWSRQREIYQDVVNRLTARRTASPVGGARSATG